MVFFVPLLIRVSPPFSWIRLSACAQYTPIRRTRYSLRTPKNEERLRGHAKANETAKAPRSPPRYTPAMSNTPRENILLWAVLAATAALTFSGWVWWEQRGLSWSDRPWYAAFPPLTALGVFVIGGVLGWMWQRGTQR